ncbi:sugar transferase [Aureicoccus marinus]|uniref:Lipid carrier--UDP-N-acetylgalactosaminyltransferase n=1 Tax=Aureicoccus marinus TaxID=754435 RepID=A0A2S7T6W2_9FLAO|nr:sugar transferase [Aureicoccus marinus]PQJ15245.1 lipid carrier--UDP-N-acetylgalactosaminyltransferase [Aureicoccus marinus]
MYSYFIKPLFDIVFSSLLFLITLPLLIVTTVALSITNGGKPFFFQQRPGKNGQVFKIVKFKTMNDKKDLEGNLLSDELRLTPIGQMVRKLSIDELPQLINIMKGDMSFVGPRPLLVQYLERYNSFQLRRHDVKPGITGWAQVNGRNAISWTKKFELDVWYVNHQSFSLDLKILFKTVGKILQQEGISSESSATMEEFMGEGNL